MYTATSHSARCAATIDRIPPRLLRVYRDTLYHAKGCDVRIGRRAPDALFALLGSRVGTFVTAWNPRSRRMPEGWRTFLLQVIRALCCAWHASSASAVSSLCGAAAWHICVSWPSRDTVRGWTRSSMRQSAGIDRRV